MNQLHNRIIERICMSGGRIPFADFMAEALYHPVWGYYNRTGMTIGEKGDFYTAPMVHPIFGQCVARQVYQMWRKMGSPDPFVIVEAGAGTGVLARDFLAEWDRLQQDRVRLQYRIVEQSPILKELQRDTTNEVAGGRISWHSAMWDVPDYGGLIGVILSNELFDALPVHRLIMENGQLHERYVTFRETTDGVLFEEISGSLSDEKLAEIVDESVREELEDGDRLEVCPFAGRMIGDMADALQRGFVITIDYGDKSPEVYWKSAGTGGVRCYYKQTLVTDPFQRIGEQDITADVDFSYLQRQGEAKGLQTVSFTTQMEFLEKFGFLHKVTELQRLAFRDLRSDFELQKMLTLYLPQGLGEACKVLIQSKG